MHCAHRETQQKRSLHLRGRVTTQSYFLLHTLYTKPGIHINASVLGKNPAGFCDSPSLIPSLLLSFSVWGLESLLVLITHKAL